MPHKLQSAVVSSSAAPKQKLSIDDRRASYVYILAASSLHRIDWICDMRVQDPSFDCVTKEAWSAWRLAWAGLCDEKKLGIILSITQLQHEPKQSLSRSRHVVMTSLIRTLFLISIYDTTHQLCFQNRICLDLRSWCGIPHATRGRRACV